jgi:hypothetical protein
MSMNQILAQLICASEDVEAVTDLLRDTPMSPMTYREIEMLIGTLSTGMAELRDTLSARTGAPA